MPYRRVYILLSIATCCIFTARGFQYYWHDAPFRILVWDENLMKPIVENYFSISWERWTQNPENEEFIVAFAKKISVLYFISALLSLLLMTRFSAIKWVKILFQSFIFLAFLNLLLLYFLYSKDKSYRPTEFLEYALQWGIPLLLIFYKHLKANTLEIILKILCAAVFISHGLYAVDYYPTPVTYISMTINGLNCSEDFAKSFLILFGVLDIVFSLGLFYSKTFKISILYLIIWGFITTVARLYCNWYHEAWELSLQQYFHEMFVRIPHFLSPFALFLIFVSKKSQIAV
jgi:hypothetical protein